MEIITTIGLDIAKSVFHAVCMNGHGKVVRRSKLSRRQVLLYFHQLPKAVIGIEACGGSHYWARELSKIGHEVKLIAPQFVKPYVKSNKNDIADAEAICEAISRPTMRFVSCKSVEQQDIQCLHRVRERLVSSRTALINEIRGLLLEYGIVVKKGAYGFTGELVAILEKATSLTAVGSELFKQLRLELLRLNDEIKSYDHKLKTFSANHPICKRLQTISGVGPLTASAIVSAVGDVSCFKNGRQFAAWLGLVPRQQSTGGKTILRGISKRGDKYIRKLLVHGARATLRWNKNKTDRRSLWINQLIARRGYNRATVALANKNARVIWALLFRNETYKEFPATV